MNTCLIQSFDSIVAVNEILAIWFLSMFELVTHENSREKFNP